MKTIMKPAAGTYQTMCLLTIKDISLHTALISKCDLKVSPYSEALPERPSIFYTVKKSPHILWNPKAHYHVHKSLPTVPLMTHINPVHTIPSYSF
jgi:hypothetical protein